MARRGVFGRLPRAAPDLTNTLVALIREANAQEDQNYVDAWKNGGQVEGKGVDDDRLLEHLKKRRDALSPDDPLWDQWNNRVAQYDFSINESKMSLKFDQGKVSEQEVANFYGKWVNRPEIQQDSEFYRHLLSQQAKWHEAAKQGRASGGRSNAYANHNKWAAGVLKDKVKPASDAAGAILQIAKIYEAVPGSASSLVDVYENTKGWGRVLDIIDDGVSDNSLIQEKINQAEALIQKTMGKDWKWNTANINALFTMADEGNKSLIRNSMNDTERKQWRKQRSEMGFERTRVANIEASARVAQAGADWADDLDDCKGDAYCAKTVTKTYRDILVRESKTLVTDVKLGNEDTEQAGMLVSTISQLDDVIAGRPVDTGRGPQVALTGVTTKEGVDLTQPDIAAGSTTPSDFIAQMGNKWNDDIKKLNSGGWVSSEPVLRQDGSQVTDGENNPQFQFITHDADEAPMPGLVPVTGVVTMTDPLTVDIHAPGGPKAKAVTPVQWVTATPASVVTVDEGGRPVTPDNGVVGLPLVNGKPDPKATPQTQPTTGYEILTGVTGPDGTARTMYRTGDGAKVPFMYHTEPPLPLGTKTQLDPKTGAKVPILTATMQPGPLDAEGNPTSALVYDTSIFASGFAKARTQTASGNFVLGTFRTVGAASTAQSINSVFAKGGDRPTPAAITEANRYLNQFKTNIDKLPANDPTRLQSNLDFGQLQQTVSLHAGNKFGKTIDDAYGALNDRTAGQQRYEEDLARRGISTAKGYTEEEVSRRVSVLEQIDLAEGRLERMPSALGRALMPGSYGAWSGPGQQNEIDAILRAKQDVGNPLISVSGIKVPGFAPQMEGTTWAPSSVTGGIVGVGGPKVTGGPTVTGGPQIGIKKQTPFAPPGVIKNGLPVSPHDIAASVTITKPPKPLTSPLPGKQPYEEEPLPPIAPLPALSPAAELRRQEEERNRHGMLEF